MATLDQLFDDAGAPRSPYKGPVEPPVPTPTQAMYAPQKPTGLKLLTIPPPPAALPDPAAETHLYAPAALPWDLPELDLPAPQAQVGGGSLPDIQAGRPAGSAEPVCVKLPTPSIDSDLSVAQVLSHLPFVYLSGAAGTGKTWLAREIVRGRDDAILTATTGIASVNLGDASTINSVLSYFDTQSMLEHYASGFLQTRLRQLRRSGVRTIVLDEVSMLDADQLTALCQAMDEVNLKKSYDASLGEVSMKEHDDGTMGLLLVGDFAQLPPVEAAFAFESPEWKRFTDHTLRLDTIRRQGDQTFIQALQSVRKGDGLAALSVLEPRMVPTLDFDFKGTTIVAKNDEVDRINGMRFARLAGAEFTWKTIRSGEQQKDWLRLIPEEVVLKTGALVMILANRPYPKLDEDDVRRGFYYVNGDLATVVRKEANGIRVMLHRTFEEVTVVPFVSEWKLPTGKKNPAFETKGTCTRMPLRLAYATTVHKSQGLSLDEVQISMASWMFGKPSMLYVALSRCRSLEGLRIVGNAKMFLGKCSVEPKIRGFL